MKVLQIAYSLAPVGVDAVGGAEQVLAALDDAVVRAGGESLVVALEGSRCAGRLISVERPRDPFDEAVQRVTRDRVRAAAADVIARERVDVVHLHGVDFPPVLPPPGPPALVTLHLPRAWYPRHLAPAGRPRSALGRSDDGALPGTLPRPRGPRVRWRAGTHGDMRAPVHDR